MLQKIVSGGQTGVDRAALDAALEAGMAAGGWCPRGRRAADGVLARRYPLCETPSARYAERTAWNVRDSDGTLLLCPGRPDGGTALTLEVASRLGKPALLLDPMTDNVEGVRAWLRKEAVRVLNVAGPREEEHPGIYATARTFLTTLLQQESIYGGK